MSSDRSWMTARNRWSPEYRAGVRQFIEIAQNHVNDRGLTRCPCKKCGNAKFQALNAIPMHLYVNGIVQSYKIWYYHGESLPRAADIIGDENRDEIADILEDVYAEENMPTGNFNDPPHDDNNHRDKYDDLFKEMASELYPGCRKYSALNFLIKLMHLKVINKCSNHYFDGLLELLVDALPDGTILPKSHYEAKAKLRSLGLGYESIDACKHDCALFWKENAKLEFCPVCGECRWQDNHGNDKKVAHKVMRYFPVTPRLKRLYSSRYTAEDMRWHYSKRPKEDGVLRHPADSKAWKHLDELYPSFAAEPRNVRLGLATDGFNPFGNMSNSYSMWPVILVPYNLPPWKCMKSQSLMLSLLIPGPSSPGKDIDVFLRPLVDELKELWVNGVETRDAYNSTLFTMRAAILWTINDYPAYAMMSGWSTKGYKACPTCNEETSSVGIRSKISYIGHRRFLDMGHQWRSKRALFDGNKELRPPPKEYSGDDVLLQLENLQIRPSGKHKEFGGVKRKRTPAERNWSKKSILFELDYWSKLLLRHNLDVMHIEKNICDSVLGTLLNLEGKSKDTDKARLDLADMKIREKLHLYKDGNKWKKPPASYTLSVPERRIFCEFVKSVEFPDGFAANLSKNVNIHDGKISGLKSHDCHVLFQQLIPAGLRSFLVPEVRRPIIELCEFFKKLCSRTLHATDLEKMIGDIITILCKLEMIFPPAFFDIMVHLALHLPKEAILGGPVHFRWMYPIERSMAVYKQYVRNRARPEGSIAEAYVVNEALTFCSMYLRGVETRFNRPERNDDRVESQPVREYSVFKAVGRPFGKKSTMLLNPQLKQKAEWYILNNCTEIKEYLRCEFFFRFFVL